MKQFTIRLEDIDVQKLEDLMKKHGYKSAQQAFLHMVITQESLEVGVNYWQEQHDLLSAEYQRLTEKTDEKIALLRSIIEEGLGKKVI